jgi:pimeloyl-ACP methyl ester carboxylesterase
MNNFVYKSNQHMKVIHQFYDEALASLSVEYREQYIDTAYGKTHVLILGDENKEKIFTLHGGNGINPLNIRIFQPLLKQYCIVAPDVIGMPGKSEPYRNLDSKKNNYGLWILEVMDTLDITCCMFVVSSYSSAMLLSLAKLRPDRISKAVLLVPSGITHGPLLPIIVRMAVPFMKYYVHPTSQNLDGIMDTMITEGDNTWRKFLHLMMSGYKMEMRAPKEFKAKELSGFTSPILITASQEDIFFPADRVFMKAGRLFKGDIYKMLIDGKHLPSQKTMIEVCREIIEFDKKTEQ